LSGQDALRHAQRGAIDALPHHTDVHDGDNTGGLSHVSRSKNMIYDNTTLDALRIGANIDELDGNKRYPHVLEIT